MRTLGVSQSRIIPVLAVVLTFGTFALPFGATNAKEWQEGWLCPGYYDPKYRICRPPYLCPLSKCLRCVAEDGSNHCVTCVRVPDCENGIIKGEVKKRNIDPNLPGSGHYGRYGRHGQ